MQLLGMFPLVRLFTPFIDLTGCIDHKWMGSVPHGDLLLFCTAVSGLTYFYHNQVAHHPLLKTKSIAFTDFFSFSHRPCHPLCFGHTSGCIKRRTETCCLPPLRGLSVGLCCLAPRPRFEMMFCNSTVLNSPLLALILVNLGLSPLYAKYGCCLTPRRGGYFNTKSRSRDPVSNPVVHRKNSTAAGHFRRLSSSQTRDVAVAGVEISGALCRPPKTVRLAFAG